MKERILKILSGLRPEFDFTMDVHYCPVKVDE